MGNIQNTKKMINKDLDKLNNNYAKGKVYIAGIIKEQEAIIKVSASEIIKINEKLEQLKNKLAPYVANEKEVDYNFIKYKDEYEQAIIDRNTYQQAITLSEESISEAKLHEI